MMGLAVARLTASQISDLAEKIIAPELVPGIEFVCSVTAGRIVFGVDGMFRGKRKEMTHAHDLGAESTTIAAVTRSARYIAEMTKRSR